jgi:hypothetical protein
MGTVRKKPKLSLRPFLLIKPWKGKGRGGEGRGDGVVKEMAAVLY